VSAHEARSGSTSDVLRSGAAILRDVLSGDRGALTALPRLPWSREEAEAAARLCGAQSRVLLGADASEEELRAFAHGDSLRNFAYVHLATHALVDDEVPERSALVLSDVLPSGAATSSTDGSCDGCLTADEIAREWRLDADLVTLSACQTGLGQPIPGEGYIGLSQAVFRAGARSVIVSLWSVEDRSTSLLMRRFYECMLESGPGVPGDGSHARGREAAVSPRRTKAEALRLAKQWLRGWREHPEKPPPYAHPYYWAGFVLLGAPD
jgi:CHAT domain-containing protein